MNLVFFAHPTFLGQQSMPRFAKMLAEGMAARGHNVEIWSPKARFFNVLSNATLKKWMGYIDQYIVFPREVRTSIKKHPADTLFVFTDQALGPWVPLVAHRPHVIHCHDFMALHSALGRLSENPTSWTGQQYQQLIRRGYSKGKHFISVSKKTKDDLHESLTRVPHLSEFVYNGFHQPFTPHDKIAARESFGARINLDLTSGYILHVGGNPWYKNRAGVIDIYSAWRLKQEGSSVPLLMVGETPTNELIEKQMSSPFSSDIHWLADIEDNFVRLAYSGASVFLFPSFGEGFGWPIAEAMASGCPVITTGEPPMTEVAGDAAFLIPRCPKDPGKAKEWASEAAAVITHVLALSPQARQTVVEAGINNAKRFDTKSALDQIERIYLQILKQ